MSRRRHNIRRARASSRYDIFLLPNTDDFEPSLGSALLLIHSIPEDIVKLIMRKRTAQPDLYIAATTVTRTRPPIRSS